MSLNLIPLNVRRTVAAELDLRPGDRRVFNVIDSGTNVQYQEYESNNVSPNSIPFTCNPPNTSTVIDPKVYIKNKYQVDLEYENAAPGKTALQASVGWDAPRSYPTHTCLNGIIAQINGQSVSCVPKDWIQAFQRINSYVPQQDLDLSSFPSMPDMSVDYGLLFEQNRNPLAAYGTNPAQITRGGWEIIADLVVDPSDPLKNKNAPGTRFARAVFTTSEPVLCSPFFFSKVGITGVKTLQFTFNFNNNLQRVWSHMTDTGVTDVGLGATISDRNLVGDPSVTIQRSIMEFRWITPKLLDRIPRNLVYNYSEILTVQTDDFSLAGSATLLNKAISAINLSAVPQRIVIYARQSDSELTSKTTDSFAHLENLKVNWNGKVVNQFSNMTPYELYLMSRRNGLCMSYAQFNTLIGSIIVIDPARDIGLGELESNGCIGTPLLSLMVDVKNLSKAAKKYTLFAQVVYSGALSIVDGVVSKSISVLNAEDVRKSLSPEAFTELAPASDNYMGSGPSLWDYARDFVDAASDSYDMAHKAYKKLPATHNIKRAVDCAKLVGEYALPLVGLGELEGGKAKAKKKKGGELSGGKHMSRAELKRQMMDMME